MADPFATNDEYDFESVDKSELLMPEQQQVDSTTPNEMHERLPQEHGGGSADVDLLSGLSSSSDDKISTDETKDFGIQGSSAIGDTAVSSAAGVMADDLTPVVPEQDPFKEIPPVKREATPPPSPPPSPVTSEPLKEPEPAPQPVITSPLADSTTSASDDRPVKMPKATTISPPSRTAPARASSGCAWLKDLDPRVWEILLWRDPLVTGPLLGFKMAILISLTSCSVISVVSYHLMFILIGALLVRAYKYGMGKIHTGDDTHPFTRILDTDVSVSEQTAVDFVQAAIPKFNQLVSSVRDLLLVKDFVPSLKFALVIYAATYIGSWFNGLTLLILATVGAFTLPKVYEVNKGQIDHYVDIAQSRFEDYYKQLQDKVPFLKKQKTQ